MGSILPYHKVEILIRAFGQLQKTKANASLIIVGDGAQRPELEQLSRQMKIEDKVLFTGRIPNDKIIDQLRKMDVCVMPGTNWYGSPVKVFEYGAACKPIIAPNQVPLRDVMVSGEDGLLCEENEQSLYEAMMHMAENPENSKKMAENFHQKVMDKFTWKQAAQEIIKAI